MTRKVPALLLGALAAISLVTFDIYQPTLPAITRYFNTDHATAQLTLSLYLFFLGIGQFLWGPLVDVYGRRKPFFISMSVFLLATLLCVITPSIELMILGRLLQSTSVAVCSVIAFAATRDADDAIIRAKMMSLNSMTVALSPIFSPMVGAFLFKHFGWQSNFVFMFVIGLFIMLFALLKLNESPHFTRIKTLSATKLIRDYQQVLSNRVFVICTTILMFAFACSIIFVVNAAYLLMSVLKLSPMAFSLVFGLFGVFIIVGNFIGVALRERFTLAFNVYCGNILILIGALLMLLLTLLLGEVLVVMLPMCLVVSGVSIILPAVQTKGLEPFTTLAGTASSILTTVRTLGAAILGGLVAYLLSLNFIVFPLSILLCGLIILTIYITAIPRVVKQAKRRA